MISDIVTDADYRILKRLFWEGFILLLLMLVGIKYITNSQSDDLVDQNARVTIESIKEPKSKSIVDDTLASVKIGQLRMVEFDKEDPFKKGDVFIVKVLAIKLNYVQYRFQKGTTEPDLINTTNSCSLSQFISIYKVISNE